MRFQVIAPIIDASKIFNINGFDGRLTIFDTVFATALPPSTAPSKPKKDASIIACAGVAAPLVIKVATTELASFSPFVSVKTKAVKITIPSNRYKLTVTIFTTTFYKMQIFVISIITENIYIGYGYVFDYFYLLMV